MGGDDFQHVRPGQPFGMPAALYNALVRVAKDHAGHLDALVPQMPGGVSVLVRNDTGLELDRYAALRITSPVFTPDDHVYEFCSRIVLACALPPAIGGSQGRLAITQTPLDVDAVGPAVISGLSVARLKVGEGESGYFFADTEDETYQYLVPVQANVSGTMILWKERDLGEQWCIVRMSNPAIVGLA